MRTVRYLMMSTVAGLMIAAGVGCNGRSSIPSDAAMENSGSGRVSYTANQAGNIYVLDTDDNKKVFQGHVNNGDQVVVEPDQDRIVVGGTNADHTPSLKANHRYAIYFKADH
jgi:hypothetical protein